MARAALMALRRSPFIDHSKARKIMRYKEGKLGNSSHLMEIQRDGSLETCTGRVGQKYPKENRGTVSLAHGGVEVNRTLLCALKIASFPTQSHSRNDWT